MTEPLNLTKEQGNLPKPANKWLDVGVTALIAWLIGHLTAVVIMTVTNMHFESNLLYNAIYLTITVGVAMAVVDYKISDKIIAKLAKNKGKVTE